MVARYRAYLIALAFSSGGTHAAPPASGVDLGLPPPPEGALQYVANHAIAGQSSLQLEAFKDTKIGKVDIRFNGDTYLPFLTLSGPIDENGNETQFGDLDGLKAGNKVTLGLIREKQILKAPTSTYCQRYAAKYSELFNKKVACIAETGKDCTQEKKEFDDFPSSCDAAAAKEGRSELVTDPGSYIAERSQSISISMGQSSYSWLDPESMKLSKQDEESYAAELKFSEIFGNFTRLDYGIRYEDAWKGAKSKHICSPMDEIVGALSCLDAAISAPENKENRIIFVSFESYVGQTDRFAIAPRISHDLESYDVGLDFPVYLFQSNKHELNGGANFGWTKSGADATFSIFFSKAFSISN